MCSDADYLNRVSTRSFLCFLGLPPRRANSTHHANTPPRLQVQPQLTVSDKSAVSEKQHNSMPAKIPLHVWPNREPCRSAPGALVGAFQQPGLSLRRCCSSRSYKSYLTCSHLQSRTSLAFKPQVCSRRQQLHSSAPQHRLRSTTLFHTID